MAVADASKLSTIDPALLRALGGRFRTLDLPAVHSQLPDLKTLDLAARPLRLWHLRRIGGAAAHALRCFVFDDELTEDEAREVFGEVPIDPFVAGGLVSRHGAGRIATRFQLRFSDDVYFFGDELKHGGDAVMSLGRMTIALTRAAWPKERVEAALDLGCGAGTCALLLASRAKRVVATDINERAVVLAKLNVTLNGLSNVEVRQGDMYRPVAGELFDLVVSQPPFVPMPEGAAGAVYMFGGRRGDELPLRALAELPAHLRPGGRAVMFIQWPVWDEDPVAQRIRHVIQPKDVDVLLVEAPGVSVDAECIGDLAFDHPDLGAEFARKAILAREHLEQLNIREMRDTFTIVRRTRGEPGWDGTTRVADLETTKITNANVESMLAAHSLVARGEDALAGARLRLPEGTRIARGKSSGALLVYPAEWFLVPMELDERTAAFVMMIHESLTVRDAARRFAKQQSAPAQAALPAFLKQVANAIRAGVVTIVG